MGRDFKEIKYTRHALKRMGERGIGLAEIKEAVDKGRWTKTKYQRYYARFVLEYNHEWEGYFYKAKEINVIFTVEDGNILVITAIARYFS